MDSLRLYFSDKGVGYFCWMFEGRSVCFKTDGHVAGLNWFINSREPSHAQTRWTTSHLLGWPLQGSSLITGLQCRGGYEMALMLTCPVILYYWVWAFPLVNAKKHWAAMEIVFENHQHALNAFRILKWKVQSITTRMCSFCKAHSIHNDIFHCCSSKFHSFPHCQMGKLPSPF